eukprot:1582518-Rhodomonas_salina.3
MALPGLELALRNTERRCLELEVRADACAVRCPGLTQAMPSQEELEASRDHIIEMVKVATVLRHVACVP